MLNHIFHWFALGFTMSARPPGQRLQWIFFKGEAVFVEFHHHPNQASGRTCGGVKESSCYIWNPLVSFYAHHSRSFPVPHGLRALYRGLHGALRGQSIRHKHNGTSLWAGHWSQIGHSCGHECVSPHWSEASERAFITRLLTKHTCCFHPPRRDTDALWD